MLGTVPTKEQVAEGRMRGPFLVYNIISGIWYNIPIVSSSVASVLTDATEEERKSKIVLNKQRIIFVNQLPMRILSIRIILKR